MNIAFYFYKNPVTTQENQMEAPLDLRSKFLKTVPLDSACSLKSTWMHRKEYEKMTGKRCDRKL